jgi:hypothetical protein
MPRPPRAWTQEAILTQRIWLAGHLQLKLVCRIARIIEDRIDHVGARRPNLIHINVDPRFEPLSS